MTKAGKKFGLGLIFLVFLLLPALGWGQNSCDSIRVDLNNDGMPSPTDLILLLNCVYGGSCNPLPRGDLNCDGLRTSWDVYLSLRAVFLGQCVPCGGPGPTTPDPADSVIIESKLVLPGAAAGPTSDTGTYLRVRVFITNKDTLANVTLPLEVRSISGGAFIIPGWPRNNFNGTVSKLTSTLGVNNFFAPRINSSSPDSATWTGFLDPSDPSTVEAPNATRKALWDLKFDTVAAACGLAVLDSIRIFDNSVGFVKLNGTALPVNFVQGVITVGSASPLFNLRTSIKHFGNATKGRWRWVQIRCENIGGSCPTVPTVTWNAPPQAQTIFAYPRAYPVSGAASVPVTVTPLSATSVSWTLPGLSNGDGFYLWACYQIPCVLANGTILTNIARSAPVTDDVDSSNNTARANKPATPGPACPGPEGPLAGQVTGEAEKFSSAIGGVIPAIDTLTYQITFQNVGTGTVSNLVVQDTLDVNLDETTFDTAGASHHPYTFSRNGRVVTWTFNGINLPNRTANPVGSVGFVAFRVKLKPAVPDGALIINDAEVTFDNDPPVPSGAVPIFKCPRIKGDLVDGQFPIDVSDIVQMLICAFPLTAPDPTKCDPCYADVDCTGGDPSPTDVVTLMNKVFLDEPIDCQ